MSFAHQSLVEFIRDALWQQKPGTTTGRAAIMVGAGFSKNANPTSSAARPFPSWPALTESLWLTPKRARRTSSLVRASPGSSDPRTISRPRSSANWLDKVRLIGPALVIWCDLLP